MQAGEQKQKEISISITKIFNWPQSESSCTFDLNFYPEDSETAIIEKSVTGVFLSNSMNLNSPLKITYTEDENIVIMKLLRNRRDRKELLGEFQIDLDALRQKNVQYFPFGKDHVLQVNLYVPMKANSRSSRAEEYSSYNQRNSRLNSDVKPYGLRPTPEKMAGPERKRIPSRHEYIERQRGQGEVYEPNVYESRIKKSFSEKVFSLLQEVKSMKEDIIITSSKDKDTRVNHRNYQENQYVDPQGAYQPRIKKSMSDGKFKSYGAVVGGASGFRRDEEASKSPKPQKHRLILSTLNVVPCEQYYNKNQQKEAQGRQPKQENCRVSSKNAEPAYNVGNYGRNDYYYESRLN